eukprot:SAG31_NODE_2506_length_5591_cov_4.701384_1_plen_63_part_00
MRPEHVDKLNVSGEATTQTSSSDRDAEKSFEGVLGGRHSVIIAKFNTKFSTGNSTTAVYIAV